MKPPCHECLCKVMCMNRYEPRDFTFTSFGSVDCSIIKNYIWGIHIGEYIQSTHRMEVRLSKIRRILFQKRYKLGYKDKPPEYLKGRLC